MQSIKYTHKSNTSQLNWDFLKYGSRKFTIQYSKKISRERKRNRFILEIILKNLKPKLDPEENAQQYEPFKKELEVIYGHIAKGIRDRSKCN